ncbi:acyl-CoA thioesterase [uncultured Amnibacterium sp.]|uniref:acyl-CoA thioesterase n=1 Tax=uncultured Amnibacterium sp. TaxID=1631851 RepID=UPI0035CABDAC
MWFRTLLLQLTWRFRPRLGIHDVARLRMRVLPTDIDVLRHINNGIYLSLMDMGRWDLLLRAGVWQRMSAAGVVPVVASSTMTYRRSLQLGQRYVLETRIIGYDERSVYVEQRFTVRGEVYARGILRGAFLRRRGGVVRTAELGELLGVDTAALPVAPWIADWATAVALPSTRAEAPSNWT